MMDKKVEKGVFLDLRFQVWLERAVGCAWFWCLKNALWAVYRCLKVLDVSPMYSLSSFSVETRHV